MKGRNCLITGATSGIGRVAAEELARLGATVMIVGRNPEKTERAAAEIRQSTKNEAVDFALADLSSLAEIRELAKKVRQKFDALNVNMK